MKLCFPVEKDEGMESVVFGHFGSAPMFIIVDSEHGDIKAVNNADVQHEHGMCHPLKAIGAKDEGFSRSRELFYMW
jgi:predicted Fe-Mo cluster-binding NifX family protein